MNMDFGGKSGDSERRLRFLGRFGENEFFQFPPVNPGISFLAEVPLETSKSQTGAFKK